eukprot:1144085-Pelagomonas_calceolata.AAC.2
MLYERPQSSPTVTGPSQICDSHPMRWRRSFVALSMRKSGKGPRVRPTLIHAPTASKAPPEARAVLVTPIKRKATAQPPSPACPVTTAAPAKAPLGCKRLSFWSTNNREEKAATVRAHQPPNTQQQHHPPPAVEAAAPGQNTGGAAEKGQAASADQDSRARAHKVAQLKRHGALPGGVGLLEDMSSLQIMGTGIQLFDFHFGVI